MEKVLIDLWPFIVTATFGVIGWLWKKLLNMSDRIILLESNVNTCKTNMSEDFKSLREGSNADLASLKEKVNSERDQIYKMIEKIQQRQDNHSKKQDDLVNLFTEFKVEMIKLIGDMTSELSVIGNEVKNINRSFAVFDDGVAREAIEDDDEIKAVKARIKMRKKK